MALTAACIGLTALLTVTGCSKENPVEPEPEPAPAAGELAGFICPPYTLDRNEIIDSVLDLVKTLLPISTDDESILKSLLASLFRHDVTVAKVEYYTTGVDGSTVKASGAILWPSEVTASGRYDRIVSVTHGTVDIDSAPTTETLPVETICSVFHKTKNQIVLIADYLGYGSSRTADLQHPYLHTELTGKTCADLLEAAQSYISDSLRFVPSDPRDPIQLCGYSQGGHGAIATLFELQKRGMADRVTRVDAGAGPQDLMAMEQALVGMKGEPYNTMGYLAYFFRGIIYGNSLDVDPENIYAPEVFQENADGIVPYDLFSTAMLSTWHQALGTDVTKVLHADFFDENPAVTASDDVKTILATIDEISNVNFAVPSNPSIITFYHSPLDDQVPYICSVNAHEKWPGSSFVNLSLGAGDHATCLLEYSFRLLDDNEAAIWTNISTSLQSFSGAK